MTYTFDPSKDKLNHRNHRISLSRASEFDFDSATVKEDQRFWYDEARYIATGFLRGTLYVLVFTMPNTETIHSISLRKATIHEEIEFSAL